MAKFNCFSALIGRKKKTKGEVGEAFDEKKGQRTLQVKLEHGNVGGDSKEADFKETSFNFPVPFEVVGGATCNVKVLNGESSPSLDALDAAYEGEDEHDGKVASMRRGFSDLNLQAKVEEHYLSSEASNLSDAIAASAKANDGDGGAEGGGGEMEVVPSGHVSDPGIANAQDWGSPRLVRSCSNLETRAVLEKVGHQLPKSNSYDDMGNIGRGEFTVPAIHGSPLSVITTMSADKVVLKKGSTSHVLPSRSRKLWWKLFLMSHRNLHRPGVSSSMHLSMKNISKQTDGYCSDTMEGSQATAGMKKESSFKSDKVESPWLFSDELSSKNLHNVHRNQWMAFSSESSGLSRVDEWVNMLGMQSVNPPDDADSNETGETEITIVYPPSPRKNTQPNRHANGILSEDVVQANSVINSLNTFSTVAHIAGMGLKVIPHLSPFTSLKSVNLSGNFIAYITPGSLPKGLHTLNLSKNKIATIEGLRDLTRLRILNLSYNRISKIGHGLSSCILIKELYLAGNKISDVEGLHRLLKLTVLDLSFNKITTAKALGQLVANYNSLLALNLLGSPIQGNIGDEQLRKTLSGLLPQLTYLNKQPIKPQRAREVATNSVAKAALGNGGWNSRRKPAKRTGRVSLPTKSRAGEGSSHKSQHRPRIIHHRSPSRR